MSKLLRAIREDFCIRCAGRGTIECYDKFNNPINYSVLVTKHSQGEDINNVLDKRELSHFRCTKCGRVYKINWQRDLFPKPYYYFVD